MPGPSIIFLDRQPTQNNNELEINTSNINIINQGNESVCYFVVCSKNNVGGANQSIISEGEIKYIQELNTVPGVLEVMGKKLLEHSKSLSPNGKLEYFEKSKMYLQMPERSWSIKIQHKDHSLAINLRGLPSCFKDLKNLKMTKARRSFSRFKLTNQDQLEDALKGMEQSYRSTQIYSLSGLL